MASALSGEPPPLKPFAVNAVNWSSSSGKLPAKWQRFASIYTATGSARAPLPRCA